MRSRAPIYLAFLVSGLAFAVTVRDNGFVAPFTDPSGYVSAGMRWLSGEIQQPVPFQFQPQFREHVNMGSPLGFRPGAIRGTDVEEYPLGLPVFIAAAVAALGEVGAYVLGPLFAALLAGSAFGLGRALAGPWAGVIAALLVSASPVTVRHSAYVSSDVPCAALWAVAWLMSLTPRLGAAAASGSAVTAAIMIRPNTAPLALIVGLLVLLGGVPSARRSRARQRCASEAEPSPDGSPEACSSVRGSASLLLAWRQWRWRHAVLFGALAAIGPALVLWSNTVMYGGPLEAGYKNSAAFFRWAHVAPNLKLYPSWLFEVHTVAALAGLAAVPIAISRGAASPEAHRSRTLAVSALAFIALNLAIIVSYLSFQQWTYLRFVLPAMVALFVLLGGVTVWFAQWLARWSRWLLPLALVPAALVCWRGVPETRAALREWRGTQNVLLMGRYLREALPPNTVLLSFTHSGSLALYTGRPIVRLDIVQPDLDPTIARLQNMGYRPLLVLDEVIEAPHLPRIFPTSTFRELDWPPRATFAAFGRIWLLDPADRSRHLAGQRYPQDVLR